MPGYELKLNSYDLGVDIELYDAVQRLRFEHPEVGAVVLTSGKERIFCAGRQHPDAGPVLPRLQGELLQVHQRDAHRDRGRHRELAADLARRGERRPAPAAATSWRSPATRSSWPTTAPPRCRCPRCRCSACCPAPAASRAWSTSAGAARPRRLLLHARRGHQGQAGARVAPGRRGGAALAPRRGHAERARASWPRAPTARRARAGSRSRPLERRIEADAIAYATSPARSTGGRAWPRITVAAPATTPPGGPGGHPRGGRELLAAGGRARARRRDPAPARQRGGDRPLGARAPAATRDLVEAARPAARRSTRRTGWCARSGSTGSAR